MKKIIFAAALAGSVLATPAMAQSVVNGSFESPTVGSPTYGTPGTDGGAGYEPNNGAFGYAAAPDGNQILHLQGLGSATLSLVDLVLGQAYTVSFFAAARPGYATLPVSLAYGTLPIGLFTPTSTTFAPFSFNFTATGATGTLTFAGLNATPSAGNDQNAGIDAVSISTAVPEPATWGMMILGFGAMGYAMRRRAKVRTTVSFA